MRFPVVDRPAPLLQALAANFADEHSQGPAAYADQMLSDDPDLVRATLIADSIVAVEEYCEVLL